MGKDSFLDSLSITFFAKKQQQIFAHTQVSYDHA